MGRDVCGMGCAMGVDVLVNSPIRQGVPSLDTIKLVTMPCLVPVSYTHLDVYKRQLQDGDARVSVGVRAGGAMPGIVTNLIVSRLGTP